MNTCNISVILLICLLSLNQSNAAEDNAGVTIVIKDSKGSSGGHDPETSSAPSSSHSSEGTSAPLSSNLVSGTSPASEERSAKSVTLNIKNTKSTDQVTYEFNQSDKTYMFTSKPGYVIDKVVKDDTVLWDSKDYGYQHGSSVFVGKNGYGEQVFRVNFAGTVPRDPRDTELLVKSLIAEPRQNNLDLNVPETDSDDEDDDDSARHVISLNLNDECSNDKVTYELSADGVKTFTANDPYRFVLIKKGQYTAWRYEHGEFPYKVLILRDENANPFMRLEFPKPEPKRVRLPSERKIKRPRTEEEPYENVELPEYIDASLLQKLNSRLPVDLDINTKLSTFSSDHTRKGRTHVYTAKTDFLFHTVRVGDISLWRAREKTEYANKVEFTPFKFPGMFEVNVYHLVGGKKKYIKNVGPWRHVDLTKLNLYTVNVDSIFDTFGYHNYFDGIFGVFDAKRPFLFDKIIKYNGPGSSVTDIWHAENINEYAKRVVIDGAQPFQNTNFVMVIFNNNKRKYFLRLNNEWTEVPY